MINFQLRFLVTFRFAHSGLYVKLSLSYAAFGMTVSVFSLQTTNPESAALYFTNTASLALNIALAVNIFFYHSFGNSVVGFLEFNLRRR